MDIDPFETRTGTNYKRCWVCQKDDQKDLKNPQQSRNSGHLASTYEIAQTNVKYFLDNGVTLPCGLKEEHINDGSGIAKTLAKNKAIHHVKCSVTFARQSKQRTKEEKTR